MALDDLNLEFEDEDEAKKKKSDAVQVDVDLDFLAPPGVEKSKISTPKPAAVPSQVTPKSPIQKPMGVVQKLDEARPQGAIKRPLPSTGSGSAVPQTPAAQPRPTVVGSSALKQEEAYDLESENVVELREQMKRVEFEAAVKVAVAEFKTEFLSEVLSDMKLVEHQIGQLLARINAKHPETKQEALMMKKILADFTAKKRK